MAKRQTNIFGSMLLYVVLSVGGMWLLIEFFIWNEQDSQYRQEFYLPYELMYYTKSENQDESQATSFAMQFNKVPELEKAGFRGCEVSLTRAKYQALQQTNNQNQDGLSFAKVSLFYAKAPKRLACYSDENSIRAIKPASGTVIKAKNLSALVLLNKSMQDAAKSS